MFIQLKRLTKNTAELQIKDNGTWKGNSSGTGLRSMNERAEAINSTITIDHHPIGTQLKLLIQLP